MTRNITGALLLTPFIAAAQQSSNIEPQRYNVVFVMCDDLNDYQGVFGGHPQAHTPNIDRIASQGAQFINASANVAVSLPSRNSLFTGVHPIVSEDFGWTKRLDNPKLKANKTFVELFNENGYATYGTGKLLHNNQRSIWGKWGVNDSFNYGPFVLDIDSEGVRSLGVHKDVPAPYRSNGFVDGSYGAMTSEQMWTRGGEGLKTLLYDSDDDRALLPDEMQAQWAIAQLKEIDSEEPFFMAVGFCRPHTPMHAPEKYFKMFPLETLELSDWGVGDSSDTYLANHYDSQSKGYKYYNDIIASYGQDREIALKSFLQAYLACVAFVDEQIGAVWDALQQSPYADNTIFVLTSDHGWQMGEKEYLFKASPWEESMRIPMIISHPKMRESMQIEQPVSLVDIYPTLVNMCCLSGDNKVDQNGMPLSGHSMLPLLNAQKWDGANGVLSILGTGSKKSLAEQHLSYRTARWRYILYSGGEEELYDHQNDPFEWHNLASSRKYKKIKNSLKDEITEIIDQDLQY